MWILGASSLRWAAGGATFSTTEEDTWWCRRKTRVIVLLLLSSLCVIFVCLLHKVMKCWRFLISPHVHCVVVCHCHIFHQTLIAVERFGIVTLARSVFTGKKWIRNCANFCSTSDTWAVGCNLSTLFTSDLNWWSSLRLWITLIIF